MTQEILTIGTVTALMLEADALGRTLLPGPLARWINSILNVLEPASQTFQSRPAYLEDEEARRKEYAEWAAYNEQPSMVHSTVVPTICLMAHNLQDWHFQPKQIRHLQAFMK